MVYEDEWSFLLNISNEEVRALFGVLIYVAKTNWHDSGWIKYDEPQIMQLLGMKDHKKFLELVHQAVKLKLEFRVVGSKIRSYVLNSRCSCEKTKMSCSPLIIPYKNS